MRITKEQSDILDSFTCERFRDNDKNFDLMKNNFKNSRGEGLAGYLYTSGVREEYNNSTAYYIIKDNNNHPLMFFSLKCGSLFRNYDEDDRNDYQRRIIILQAIKNSKNNEEYAKTASKMINDFINDKQIDAKAAAELIYKAMVKKNLTEAEDLKEENENINRVLSVHSGVELVHFCANDNLKDYWNTLNMNRHHMGETLFWKFIVPKFLEVQKTVGCEYAFLFAADLSEDESLVNYYDNVFKFKKKRDVGTNKPYYDMSCIFMCQEVNQMKLEMDKFFNNFNDDIEDAV